MRSARLCTSLGVVLALLATATAQADIAPVPKPDGPAVVTPLPKPATQPPVTTQPPRQRQPVVPSRSVAPSRSRTTLVAPPPVTTPAPVVASGGREQPHLAPATATGGRNRAASLQSRIVERFPTRLAEAGDESLPRYDAWPSWVLGAFTLLASAEAFLLVRLARARRFAQVERLRQLTDH